jgi:hypothetical protein
VLAAEPSLAEWAKQTVEYALVGPLTAQQNKNSKFSRVRQPPRERRVRILATTASRDKAGNSFVPFAVDVRYGGDSEWESDIDGCVYQGSAKIFVKIGDEYRPGQFLLGKDVEPVAGVCQAAPPPAS